MSGDTETQVHASAVAISGNAVLIRGKSGSGKSSLALQLIALGAELVADDRCILHCVKDAIQVSAPPQIKGLIEARGVGIIPLKHREAAVLRLVVDLDLKSEQRLPPLRNTVINSLRLPLIAGKNVPNLAYAITAWMGGDEVRDLVDPEEWQPWNDDN